MEIVGYDDSRHDLRLPSRCSEQNKRLFGVFVSRDDDLPSSEPSSAEVNLFESRGHGETRASGTRLDLVPE